MSFRVCPRRRRHLARCGPMPAVQLSLRGGDSQLGRAPTGTQTGPPPNCREPAQRCRVLALMAHRQAPSTAREPHGRDVAGHRGSGTVRGPPGHWARGAAVGTDLDGLILLFHGLPLSTVPRPRLTPMVSSSDSGVLEVSSSSPGSLSRWSASTPPTLVASAPPDTDDDAEAAPGSRNTQPPYTSAATPELPPPPPSPAGRARA